MTTCLCQLVLIPSAHDTPKPDCRIWLLGPFEQCIECCLSGSARRSHSRDVVDGFIDNARDVAHDFCEPRLATAPEEDHQASVSTQTRLVQQPDARRPKIESLPCRS